VAAFSGWPVCPEKRTCCFLQADGGSSEIQLTSNVVTLRGPHITLAQAVKAAGLTDSGGQAKHLVRGGEIKVNGVVETRPGRKLVQGDRFSSGDADWVIAAS
jgi:ribosome-associated protein